MRDLIAPAPCLLTRVQEGDISDALPDPAWIVLHDRHADIAGARRLAAACLPVETPRLLVRSARTQTRGSLGPPVGPFWFIGALTRPELSTLGDGLAQLERLLAEIHAPHVAILAQGEGAVVALCLALLRPDRITRLHLVGGAIPENLARMPLEMPCLARMQITTDDDAVREPLQRVFPLGVVTVTKPTG